MIYLSLLLIGSTLTTSFLSVPVSLGVAENGSYISLIRKNFSSFEASFKKNAGKDWAYGKPIDEKPIFTFGAERFGTAIRFERCWICVDLEDRLIHTGWKNGAPYRWGRLSEYLWNGVEVGTFENNRFRSISGEIEPGFGSAEIAGQFHNIKLTEGFNNYKTQYVLCDFLYFGSSLVVPGLRYWETICTKQIGKRCFLHAMTNLLYTYKFSTRVDATNGLSVLDLPDKLEEYAPIGKYGNSEITFGAQMNDFLSTTGTGAYLNPYSDGMGFAPYIANYRLHANVVDGHAAMVIGAGISDAWWVFKTNWDIVLTWSQNFYFPGIKIDKNNTSSIYVVDHQYQKARWCLCKNNKLITIND